MRFKKRVLQPVADGPIFGRDPRNKFSKSKSNLVNKNTKIVGSIQKDKEDLTARTTRLVLGKKLGQLVSKKGTEIVNKYF